MGTKPEISMTEAVLSAAGRSATWLTPKQAAEYLQVTTMTLYRWAAAGRLPFYKLGNFSNSPRRYRKEDLDVLVTPGGDQPREE